MVREFYGTLGEDSVVVKISSKDIMYFDVVSRKYVVFGRSGEVLENTFSQKKLNYYRDNFQSMYSIIVSSMDAIDFNSSNNNFKYSNTGFKRFRLDLDSKYYIGYTDFDIAIEDNSTAECIIFDYNGNVLFNNYGLEKTKYFIEYFKRFYL